MDCFAQARVFRQASGGEGITTITIYAWTVIAMVLTIPVVVQSLSEPEPTVAQKPKSDYQIYVFYNAVEQTS